MRSYFEAWFNDQAVPLEFPWPLIGEDFTPISAASRADLLLILNPLQFNGSDQTNEQARRRYLNVGSSNHGSVTSHGNC